MDKYKSIYISYTEVLHLLEVSGWAAILEHAQLETLVPFFHAYVFDKDVKLLQEGKRNDVFGIVAKGKAMIVKNNNLDKPIDTIGPGKVVGEISFFDEEPCSADVIATEEMVILLMNRIGFARLRQNHPIIAIEIILLLLKSVSQRLRKTTGLLVDKI